MGFFQRLKEGLMKTSNSISNVFKQTTEIDDDFYDDYDTEEEYRNPENKRAIPDGEQAFFSAIKNGEDW